MRVKGESFYRLSTGKTLDKFNKFLSFDWFVFSSVIQFDYDGCTRHFIHLGEPVWIYAEFIQQAESPSHHQLCVSWTQSSVSGGFSVTPARQPCPQSWKVLFRRRFVASNQVVTRTTGLDQKKSQMKSQQELVGLTCRHPNYECFKQR